MYRVSLACCVVVTIALDCRLGSTSATLISFCMRVLGMEAWPKRRSSVLSVLDSSLLSAFDVLAENLVFPWVFVVTMLCSLNMGSWALILEACENRCARVLFFFCSYWWKYKGWAVSSYLWYWETGLFHPLLGFFFYVIQFLTCYVCHVGIYQVPCNSSLFGGSHLALWSGAEHHVRKHRCVKYSDWYCK